MGENSAIAWTHHTFSPWWGCTRVSPGCEHCYAEAFTKRVGHGKRLPQVWGVDSERRPMSDDHWKLPLRWNRKAAAAGVRHRVFCASMADVFETPPERNAQAWDVIGDGRRRLWGLIAATPHLDWLLLTKRPQNVAGLVPWGPTGFDRTPWPRNVWLGTTAEDQQRADERLPILLSIPAMVRFASYEPAIGPVDFSPYLTQLKGGVDRGLDWLIVGGESGPGARPFALEWAERTLYACRGTTCAPFVKQLGAYVVSERRTVPYDPVVHAGRPSDYASFTAPGGGVYAWRAGLKDGKGGDPSEWPPALYVRQFPQPSVRQ